MTGRDELRDPESNTDNGYRAPYEPIVRVCDRCGETESKAFIHCGEGWLCYECDNYEPPDPDGEAMTATERAGLEREQMAHIQRTLKR